MATGNDTSGPSPDQLLTIGEVARRAGRRASSIRYYESIGVLPEAQRIAGQRRYGPDMVRQLAVIDAAQRAGLSLEQIRDLLTAGRTGTPVGDRLRALAERRLREVEALIEQAETSRHWLQAASRCQCLTLDDCPLMDPHVPWECS